MKEGNRPCSSKKQVNKLNVKKMKMEVRGDVNSKEKLDQREVVKQMRNINEVTDLSQDLLMNGRKEGKGAVVVEERSKT